MIMSKSQGGSSVPPCTVVKAPLLRTLQNKEKCFIV